MVIEDNKITLTQEGYNKLEEEYRHLIDVDRPEVIEQLKAARAQGDLSENADYDAARNRQAQIEARINEIEHIKSHCKIVDAPKNGKRIFLGNTVTYKEVKSGEEYTIKLVGSVEADPFAEPIPLVSNESALGKALMDKVPSDLEVRVESSEPYDIIILKAVSSR